MRLGAGISWVYDKPMSDARESSVRVEITQLIPTIYPSAHELAGAFGSVVFEPGWWPEDMAKLTYELFQVRSGPRYQIGSVRTDGRPIMLLGQVENPRARLPEEDWYEPLDLVQLGGKVAATDIGYRAALRQDQQALQLIGYSTEAEVVRAALSLRRVTP
jgi:hypothetical protein